MKTSHIIKCLATTVMLVVCSVAMAQSDGDKLFLEGQELQQTQTISSQQSAIKKFQAAKIAYTTTEKKTMCDNQITICNNNIASIRAARKVAEEKAKAEQAQKEQEQAAVEEEKEPEPTVRTDVTLTLSETRVDFKSTPKEGATQSVEVNCNYDDWEVADYPEWVIVYRGTNKISVEAEENTEEEARSGIITIRCDETEATLIVNQKKKDVTTKSKDKLKKIWKAVKD